MVVPPQTPVNEGPDFKNAQPADDVGGWLLLLCLLLLVAQPLRLALSAARSLGALPARGIPLAVVVLCQLMIAGIGVSAGLALLGRRRGAVASREMVSGAVRGHGSVRLRHAVPAEQPFPGTTPLYAAASLAYYAVWLEYLLRSKRVRRTFPQ